METTMRIAEIPADRWVGRRVRFWGHENKQHPTPCLIMGLDGNRKVIIKPIRHKKTELVNPEDILPTWKLNDDLRQEFKVTVEEPELTEDIASLTWDQEVPVSAPVATIEALPTAGVEIKYPRMVVHARDAGWMPLYADLLKSMREEAVDRQLLEEVEKSIAARKDDQFILIKLLAEAGVEIKSDEEGNETPSAPAQTAPPLSAIKAEMDGKRRSRREMDSYVIAWAKTIRSEVIANGGSLTGNIDQWSKAIDITWLTLARRLAIAQKSSGLLFTDAEGRTGVDCKGPITVTLAE